MTEPAAPAGPTRGARERTGAQVCEAPGAPRSRGVAGFSALLGLGCPWTVLLAGGARWWGRGEAEDARSLLGDCLPRAPPTPTPGPHAPGPGSIWVAAGRLWAQQLVPARGVEVGVSWQGPQRKGACSTLPEKDAEGAFILKPKPKCYSDRTLPGWSAA